MNSSNKADFKIIHNSDDVDFKKELFKYLYYWKYFLISVLTFLIIAFTFLRYSDKVYESVAKIQIIDKKENSFELPSAANLFSAKSTINLENEMEVLKSSPILEEVINNNNLQISVYAIGNVTSGLKAEHPFDLLLNVDVDSLSEKIYRINKTENGFEIINLQDDKSLSFKGTNTSNYNHNLPFDVLNFDKKKFNETDYEGYEIRFSLKPDITEILKKSLFISQVGKESDIIELKFRSADRKYSEKFLNELIDVFNNDGVKDRQLIHKNTIDFVNARYSYLSLELDSIEIAKQLYKADNELVNLSANSAISLEKSYKSEEDIFSIENQISIINLLIETLVNDKLDLLPTNMVIENSEINMLISEYNEIILERNKLIFSAGNNNPSTKQLDNTIRDVRSNIIFSLKNHLSQLKNLKSKLSNQFYKYNDDVSNLPEKEKVLRAIERNQKVKESLYLFLLQKREEAEVSYAVTEPSIKIVEYAISEDNPVSPKQNFIYLGAVLLGLVFPFLIIYLMFFFNRKIYSREQFEELKLPIQLLSEVPEITNQSNTTISSSNERSPLAESFRVLYSKLKYFNLDSKKEGHITMVTSTVKGEGKTFCAVNLALTMSTLGKKVLLIGADLHNPQIHTYINSDKGVDGLVNYLVDYNFNWKKAILKSKLDENCDILLAGQIPPNPAQLLNNGNFKKLLDFAKQTYDQIIIDTPPTLLVSDTLSMTNLADLVLFVVRCNYSNIDVLEFMRDSYEKGVIGDNSLVILNGLGATNKYGYGYAYNYNYGYRYKYGYNYNYGYGYEYKSEEE